jgi:hypothetical protein
MAYSFFKRPLLPDSEIRDLLPAPRPHSPVRRMQFLFEIFLHAATEVFDGAHSRIWIVLCTFVNTLMRNHDCAHNRIGADEVLKLPVKDLFVLSADALQLFWRVQLVRA